MRELSPATGYVLSPELITAPYALQAVRSRMTEVQQRIDTVKKLSEDHPEASILLGTPTLGDDGLMRNSLAVISQGRINGHIDKRGVMSAAEEREFTRQVRPQTALRTGHAALICSDIIAAAAYGRATESHTFDNGWLRPDTTTLLVSSCWAVPQFRTASTPASDEERFGGALKRTIGNLFSGYPNLEEIIVVDRALPFSSAGPYTGQFSRLDKPHRQTPSVY